MKQQDHRPRQQSKSSHAGPGATVAFHQPVQFRKDHAGDDDAFVFSTTAPAAFHLPVQRKDSGLATKAGPVAQLKTTIKHTVGTVPLGETTFMVGKKMEAKLDPDDWVKGSATTADNYEWMKSIRAYYGPAGVIRGHLLNHDLGGYGVPENLYPISSMANSEHSNRVEQNVKEALSESASDKKSIIEYDVKVNEKGPSGAPYETAEFECRWTDQDGDEKNETIESKLNVDKGWGGKSSTVKKSPAKWRHGSRRGEEDIDREIDHYGSIEMDYSGLGLNSKNLKELRSRSVLSGGISNVQDWKEAIAMLGNEIDELGGLDQDADIFKKGYSYYEWLIGEITDIENNAGSDKNKLETEMGKLTSRESARMMNNLKALRQVRIYEQDGIDTEANFTVEEDDVDMEIVD